nr:MAG TPA: Radical SAM superfamily [Caudoviricetes sp.]
MFSLLLCALACESRCHFCSMSKVKSLIMSVLYLK